MRTRNMELQTESVEIGQDGKIDTDHKFGVFRSTKEMLLVLFNTERQHSSVCTKYCKGDKKNFIGAGFVHANGDIDFFSDSCQEELGADRPQVLGEQQNVIEEIRATLTERRYI